MLGTRRQRKLGYAVAERLTSIEDSKTNRIVLPKFDVGMCWSCTVFPTASVNFLFQGSVIGTGSDRLSTCIALFLSCSGVPLSSPILHPPCAGPAAFRTWALLEPVDA